MVDVDLGFVGPSRPANDHDVVETVDGDTPRVTMDIRIVSIDTPETRFENLTPASAQAKLERAKARLQDGTYDALPEPLREYLTSRITPDAAQRHIDAGLSGAKLSHTGLNDADLSGADLQGVKGTAEQEIRREAIIDANTRF